MHGFMVQLWSSGEIMRNYYHQFITHKGSHKTKRLWKKTYKNVKLDCRAGPRQNHFTTKQLIIMHQAGTNHSQMINVNNLILTKTLKVTVLVSLFSLLTPKSVDLTQSLNSRGPECASGSAPWDWPHMHVWSSRDALWVTHTAPFPSAATREHRGPRVLVDVVAHRVTRIIIPGTAAPMWRDRLLLYVLLSVSSLIRDHSVVQPCMVTRTMSP